MPEVWEAGPPDERQSDRVELGAGEMTLVVDVRDLDEAVGVAGDERGALTGMAHHLERTALRVLTDCAPEFVPVAVPHAVALIDTERPAARVAS